jgi:molecular chaperone DnaK (HSP70)
MAKVVGIDLGTTHTVVAWAEADGQAAPEVFAISQLVDAGAVDARALLPSCLYAPASGESFADEWRDAPWVVGELARRRGAEVSGRLVASAKSWLSHAAVDRTAAILPWGGDDAIEKLSPVDASARILTHVRAAWDAAHPGDPLNRQDVVLTVPASFDAAARELTIDAATRAGISPKLLEEPQAAFYDYRAHAGATAMPNGLVLVCDVGGGTTDLSLLRVDGTDVERVAVGHHLLLGGDNMDLALALLCEARLGTKLDAARFGQLATACRGAKERLLGDDAPASVRVALASTGSNLVGGTLSLELSRGDVERVVLDGFFPLTPRDARPERARSALVAFGLPYERDVAVTRHVAWFFARHAPEGAHPSAVLLNGGVFRAKRIAERLVEAIEGWGGPKVTLLAHDAPDLGVARGAVLYGLALRGNVSRGARIRGGSPRAYYIGLGARDGEPIAMCVVPRGAAEGEVHTAHERPIALRVGRTVRFDLFASDDASADSPGDVVALDEGRFVRLPPVTAAFDSRVGELRVAIEGELTPLGTLELACVVRDPPRRFRLAFELRAPAAEALSQRASAAPSSVSPATKRFADALEVIERAFGKRRDDETGREAKDVVRDLEKILGERATWTLVTARALFDALIPHRAARRRSAEHERAFWMLAGFCIRPGFGDPSDAARVGKLVPLLAERLAFPDEARGWQQFFIAWRRAAAGLDETSQEAFRAVFDPFIAPAEAGLKRPKKLIVGALDDLLETAASFERLPWARRAELGGWILERTWTDRDPRLWAALGRIGARAPAYASIHHVVAAHVAEKWLEQLLREKWGEKPTCAPAAVRIARLTGDRARDLGDAVRLEVAKRLVEVGARDEQLRAVREVVPVGETERAAFYGEGLPVGLRLVE